MYFKNRADAGQKLAQKLKKYKGRDIVVYALPRGGVVTANEIAKCLNAPLDLIITRKIGHPYISEYAIAAVAENGHIVKNEEEVKAVDQVWFRQETKNQRQEAKRRRELYLGTKASISPEGKIAILVDDGIATGLTMRVAILELKHRHPKKIIVAVPIAPKDTASQIGAEVDEFVALDIPSMYEFLGGIGAYYDEFLPVEDNEVIKIMKGEVKQNGHLFAAQI
ncbi:MAG: phosphoribosyltransferase family protein [Candidatus Curtissbacteria bacterium]|nr:phosphoribosyltransferase family protein [Candidatus Curtissbacteria bacterium]